MCLSQDNRFLLIYYFGKFLFDTCSYVVSDTATSKIGVFVILANCWKPSTNITKSSILDVAGSEIRVCYQIFYRIVLFCYLESENSGSTVTSTETEPVISSADEIIEEDCLTSKTVKDEDRIPIDTNDTIDVGKITVNEVKRDTLTRDQIYRYLKHQKITSEKKDFSKKQVTKADKTFVLRFKRKWLQENS